MKRVKDLAVKVGSYTKDGKEKGRYLNIGTLMQDDKGGQFILLDRTFNPAGVVDASGKSSVLVSLFDPQSQSKAESAQRDDVAGSDIPF